MFFLFLTSEYSGHLLAGEVSNEDLAKRGIILPTTHPSGEGKESRTKCKADVYLTAYIVLSALFGYIFQQDSLSPHHP